MKNIALVFLIFFVVNPLSAEIYKWVDEQGRVHYDDKPPLDGNKQQLNISDDVNAVQGLSDERAEKRRKLLDAIDEDRKKKQEKTAADNQKKDQLRRQCNEARDRLKNYKKAGGLYDLDKAGNRVSLSATQHQQAIKNLEQQISKHCKP